MVDISLVFKWFIIIIVLTMLDYNGDLKSYLLKSRNNCNLDVYKVEFKIAMAIVPTIRKTDHTESGHFCQGFKWFLTKWRPFAHIVNRWASRFQIPFKIWTICNQWKSRLVQISDPHCNL